MKIIKPNAAELVQGVGFHSMLQHIEFCGRTCYKSEDKITEDSCNKFVNMLREREHGAMLEHGTVYLTIPEAVVTDALLRSIDMPDSLAGKLSHFISLGNRSYHTKYRVIDNTYYVTTNYRAIIEGDLEFLIDKYRTECREHHYKRRTFKITCNRGVSHEFVRHRVFSFAQESQRYVNYSKEKFGKEIKVIKPLYFNDEFSLKYLHWKGACEDAERRYFTLLANNATPQEAREVLPNACATELIMTGFESDWEHFFILRCAKDAHPQAQEVANMIKSQF